MTSTSPAPDGGNSPTLWTPSTIGGAKPRLSQAIEHIVKEMDRLGTSTQLLSRADCELVVAEIDSRSTRRASEVEAIYRGGGCLWARTLASNDPPDHRRFRSLVERIFTSAKVSAIESAVRALAGELLDSWPEGIAFDGISCFASPLPLRIIARELGVPEEDAGNFKRWSDAALATLSLHATADDHLGWARSGVEFQQYFGRLLDNPELQPEGSLLQLVAAQARRPEFAFSRAEQLSLLHTLMIAGHETATATLGEMLLVLAREPRWLAEMREGVQLHRRFIEEILRLAAPAQGLFRIAARDTNLGGLSIPARSVLSLRFAAANRDPGRFPEPATIRLDRPAVPPHLAFGAGIHFCIGAPLARRELLVALEQLADRFERIELAVPQESLRYTQSVTTRGLLALPIVVTRREAHA